MTNGTLGPRIIIAGTSSGVGKTTIATAIMAILTRMGRKVAPGKIGPDFIDPTYHELACGVRGRNLDTFLLKDSYIPTALHFLAKDRDIAVIEGVMGLFDGTLMQRYDAGNRADPRIPAGSTAEIAAMTQTPIILVLDATATSSSLAAVVEGFSSFSKHISIAGIIVNNYGSESHLALISHALASVEIPLVGAIPRGAVPVWRSRHLGLIPVIENRNEIIGSIDRLATSLTPLLNIGEIVEIANGAFNLPVPIAENTPPTACNKTTIALAAGKAFSFLYPENVHALQSAGAKIEYFDPLHDESLPPGSNGLYVGGGFPEIYAERLSTNVPLLRTVRTAIEQGLPTWAECGGLMWLSDTVNGKKMVGALPTTIELTNSLTLGYVSARPLEKNCLADAGEVIYGHEFHYSKCEPGGDGISFTTRNGTRKSGFLSPSLFASYLHVNLGTQQDLANNFVEKCT